jgi:hypothetical protein
MTFGPCVHEKELTALLALGHYPHACPPDLRAHVSACRSCSELALVTRAFQTARAQTAAAANLASPGLLWWRAQLRRRNEAVERVGKPILGANIFALSVMFLFAIGFLATQATSGLRWLSWFKQIPPAPAFHAPAFHLQSVWPSALLSSTWGLPLLIPVCATLTLLGGVVVYLALEKQ